MLDRERAVGLGALSIGVTFNGTLGCSGEDNGEDSEDKEDIDGFAGKDLVIAGAGLDLDEVEVDVEAVVEVEV